MSPAGPLRRDPDGVAEVAPAWPGATVICIAGGPSLNADHVNAVQTEKWAGRARVIAVNDAYLLAPWADVLYFADVRWWQWHKDQSEFRAFAGQKCTIENTSGRVTDPDVFMLKNAGVEGLSDDSHSLRNGRTSGYQAINLAALAGALRIILLGYDGRVGQDGRAHWFGDHPERESPLMIQTLSAKLAYIAAPLKARGIQVINASPGTAIECFSKLPLNKALELST